jgi:lipoprotein-anchoring transpeptidase ErfK/SrfK
MAPLALMTRIAIIAAAVLITLAGVSFGALAFADAGAGGKLPAGATVAGIDVGGLTREDAIERTRRRVGALITRPVKVELADHDYTLKAQQAGVRADVESAVARAYETGRQGSFVTRGWREISGETVPTQERVPITADRSAVNAFVARIQRKEKADPVDASLKLSLTSVSVQASKPGRRLAARDALVARLMRQLTSRSDDRTIRARTIKVDAKVTEDDIFDKQPAAVTVSRDQKRVRLFKRGSLVKTYTVAVGSAEYPSPTGHFAVQTKQVNPAWNVPNSSWAGSLAGQTIPSGDPANPLVARWIGFAGSVGFHGTASSGSLGTAASHGCVRMSPDDVIDLYTRVDIGTPVLVA